MKKNAKIKEKVFFFRERRKHREMEGVKKRKGNECEEVIKKRERERKNQWVRVKEKGEREKSWNRM